MTKRRITAPIGPHPPAPPFGSRMQAPSPGAGLRRAISAHDAIGVAGADTGPVCAFLEEVGACPQVR